MANTLSSLFNVGLLFYAFRRKLRGLDLTSLARQVVPMILAAGVAGECAWLTSRTWERSLGAGSLPLKLGAVFVPMTAAAAMYWVMTLLAKTPQAWEFFRLLRQRLRLGVG